MLLTCSADTIDKPVLAKNAIDIWAFPLANLPSNASALLSKDELERANRFHFDRHRRRFIVARATLRLILAKYLQQDPAQLCFDYNKQGKPELDNQQGIEFNLSHSEDLALLAVGQFFPLGVDLEFFSSRPYEGIAKTLFSSLELKHFLALPNLLKPQAFFHIWAQKEAFIKATGLGLSYPTQDFSVPIHPPSEEIVPDLLHNKHWKVISFMPQVACNAALCCHPDVNTIRYINKQCNSPGTSS